MAKPPVKGQWPFDFVDIHGRPFGVGGQVDEAAAAPAAPRPQRPEARRATPRPAGTATPLPKAPPPTTARQPETPLAPQATDPERVLDALALAGWRRGRTALASWLRALGWPRARGGWFTPQDLEPLLQQLARQGCLKAAAGDVWQLPAAQAEARLPGLLRQPQASGWWRLWLWVANGAHGQPDEGRAYFSLRGEQEGSSLLRLLLLGDVDGAEFDRLLRGPLMPVLNSALAADVMQQLLRWQLLRQPAPQAWWRLLGTLDERGELANWPPLAQWLEAHVLEAPPGLAAALRLRVAERRLHRGEAAAMVEVVESHPGAADFLPLLQAAALAQAGRFAEAAPAFATAYAALSKRLGKRRGFAPPTLLQWYPLACMAGHDAAAWMAARRFCVAMSGSRSPGPWEAWGLWAHVLAARLGDEPLQPEALSGPTRLRMAIDGHAMADRLLLAAWLGHEPEGWLAPQVQALVNALHRAGLPWKADLIAQACERLGWPEPARPPDAPPLWPVRWFAPRQEAWRDALAAITALGATGVSAAAGAAGPTLLHWRLRLDSEARVFDLQAFVPAASARSKAKPLTPLQLKRRTVLDARDAAVVRCLQQNPYRRNEVSFDLVAATLALQGHPAVAFDDASDQPVELSESLPVLEVRREPACEEVEAAGGDRFVFHLHDRLLSRKQPELRLQADHVDDWDAEAERRDSLRVLRDAPDRARLLRVTPAQRRVAELVAQSWAVPASAASELDAALRVLAGHFQLHSDAAAGEPVAADARLVAQLQARGDALRLLLAVRPFGDFGPLQPPGQGRARLITLHGGLSLATERDLAAERARLATVLEALPFLAESVDTLPPDATWTLDDPEQALAAVHHLGRLAGEQQAVRALEWPKGQPVRVIAPEDKAFSSTLSTGSDWFAIDGELLLDESRVLSLQQLLQLLRGAQGSRYVALGEGQYLLLTEQLRHRLAELDALAEAAKARSGELGLRLHAQTAAWLADAAPQLGLAGDAGWRRRVAALEAAAALQPTLPAGLQAELRPYQVEGHAWLRRLAAAGFGAILADDMGLGKTVQTLALLLARAAEGPALVLAPTSVCDNWADECRRFAPALQARVHGRGDEDRAALLAEAGAGDVLIVSYGLLLRDAEAFAARPWATLVLDEAQALKNAATQRVQAVAALGADFRLALTGTPVENRLADLWSIMTLVNPGLLGSESRFAERFGNPIERQRDEAARGRLRRLVSPFLLRRTKAQVLTDLPPRTEIVMRVEPEAEERAFLEAMRREALVRIAQLDTADAHKNRFNVLAELMRLRRAACDPRLAAPEIGRPGAKLRAFGKLAAELVDSGHQTLVFSQFTDFLRLLGEALDALGLRWHVLDGSTPAAARAERVAGFQRGEADFFLISLKAGGFGLNLTAADYVVIADPWWNPAAEDQAMGRAHRIGQQRPVTVYRLVTAGSVEERIVALHHDKRELAEGLLAGQEGAEPLAAAELVDLLRDAG